MDYFLALHPENLYIIYTIPLTLLCKLVHKFTTTIKSIINFN